MLATARWFAALAVLAGGSSLQAAQVKLEVLPSYSVLKADAKQTTWISVGLTGFELEASKKRAPVNVALVLDKSGSMQGDKIARAREAAISALERLRSDDIVSVITYDSTVNVLVPATKLTDRQHVIKMISQIQAGGNTALFAGVSKGAAEIRKFLDREHVNRVILLSDGLANVGPSSPGELGGLGESLAKENISVSTFGLGLGYNEDLMVQLAGRSGGNHLFVEDATELADMFNREFDDVTSVVAQDVKVHITIPEGIRPVRVLGNDAEINGQEVIIKLSQIYSRQNKHAVLELELPAGEDGGKQKLANVSVTYQNMQSQAEDRLTGSVSVKFSDSSTKVEASLNKQVMENVVALIANEQNKLATEYLDRGDLLKCTTTLEKNGIFLEEYAKKLNSDKLNIILLNNSGQAEQVKEQAPESINRARKSMRALQYQVDSQQAIQAPASATP